MTLMLWFKIRPPGNSIGLWCHVYDDACFFLESTALSEDCNLVAHQFKNIFSKGPNGKYFMLYVFAKKQTQEYYLSAYIISPLVVGAWFRVRCILGVGRMSLLATSHLMGGLYSCLTRYLAYSILALVPIN